MDTIPVLREASFPIVVSGPSGVGKTVLCGALLERLPWARRSVSATTRPPREDEIDGESYFFYSDDLFERERNEGRLVEWALVHDYHYGTPRSFLEQSLASDQSVVLNIDVQGGLAIRAAYPSAVLIFLLPPSWAVLEKRLRSRATDGEAQVENRLARAREEALFLDRYDFVVVNDEIESAVEELVTIARAERCRVSRRLVRPSGDIR